MENILDNPVYNALISGDAASARGAGEVKFFDEEVSPFAGFPVGYNKGFDDLYDQFPAGRKILYATRQPIEEPTGWKKLASIQGSQFVFTAPADHIQESQLTPVRLTKENAVEMVALAALTKPGPFDMRTIEFGHYYGFFEDGKLAAMTGQRLHPFKYSEVSAVCTHPDYLGRGYATVLLQQQLQLITKKGQTPFLHVRSDNDRAIAVYERLGFTLNGPMHFYFLRSKK